MQHTITKRKGVTMTDLSYQFWAGAFMGTMALLLLITFIILIVKQPKEKYTEKEKIEDNMLHVLQMKVIYDDLKNPKGGDDRWNQAESDDYDIDWIPAYCKNEMAKIRKQLRDLDKKENIRPTD